MPLTHVQSEAESIWPALGGVAIIVLLSWCYFGSPFGFRPEANELQHGSKALDVALANYHVAVEQGSKADMCSNAGVIADAYMRTEDKHQYQQWKLRWQHDCSAAGMAAEGANLRPST
ncbi:MAG: hypothetical protein JO142_14900 [Burkholderiales bacterium]|nr:hypothetical protein [Burkholderiales bacterium]